MNHLKKYAGILWMLIAPIMIGVLVYSAFQNIDSKGTKDINSATPWIIIISIFTPIAIGLFLFGWYAFKGLYKQLPSSSADL
jgi:ABC-type polysaccharide/polyol phosphate export permease